MSPKMITQIPGSPGKWRCLFLLIPKTIPGPSLVIVAPRSAPPSASNDRIFIGNGNPRRLSLSAPRILPGSDCGSIDVSRHVLLLLPA